MPRYLTVAIGFNRPEALQGLVNSLSSVQPVKSSVDLLISIDGDGDTRCVEVASSVHWPHGSSRVRVQPSHLGLRQHIEHCTDAVQDYDGIIVLEDDLAVSPWFLHYAEQAYEFYSPITDVAQVSLYSPRINEFCGLPFRPANDGSDVYFLKVPSSWGQLFTRQQWQNYREFQSSNVRGSNNHLLPKEARLWGEKSWKAGFYEYVVCTNQWVAYPQISLTTNHGYPGEHYKYHARDLEVPLELVQREYQFRTPAESLAKYDAWLEPLPDTLGLDAKTADTVTIDLYGSKPLDELDTPLLLSSRACSKPIRRYGHVLDPLEINVRLNTAASDRAVCLSLGALENFATQSSTIPLMAERIPRKLFHHLYAAGVCRQIGRLATNTGLWLARLFRVAAKN